MCLYVYAVRQAEYFNIHCCEFFGNGRIFQEQLKSQLPLSPVAADVLCVDVPVSQAVALPWLLRRCFVWCAVLYLQPSASQRNIYCVYVLKEGLDLDFLP